MGLCHENEAIRESEPSNTWVSVSSENNANADTRVCSSRRACETPPYCRARGLNAVKSRKHRQVAHACDKNLHCWSGLLELQVCCSVNERAHTERTIVGNLRTKRSKHRAKQENKLLLLLLLRSTYYVRRTTYYVLRTTYYVLLLLLLLLRLCTTYYVLRTTYYVLRTTYYVLRTTTTTTTTTTTSTTYYY